MMLLDDYVLIVFLDFILTRACQQIKANEFAASGDVI
jgi:hypothetical protein